MNKNPWSWYPVAATVAVAAVILAALLSPSASRMTGPAFLGNSFQQPRNYYQRPNVYQPRNSYQQPYPYQPRNVYPQQGYGMQQGQYPQAAQQFVALQVPSGGTLQVPEIGAEVFCSPDGQLVVARVYQASHAATGGMLAGDVIIQFGGQEISSPDMFFKAISAAAPEANMEFLVLRSGQVQTLSIMMGKRELDGVIVPPDAAPLHPFALPG